MQLIAFALSGATGTNHVVRRKTHTNEKGQQSPGGREEPKLRRRQHIYTKALTEMTSTTIGMRRRSTSTENKETPKVQV